MIKKQDMIKRKALLSIKISILNTYFLIFLYILIVMSELENVMSISK